jgi:hypothetical protein
VGVKRLVYVRQETPDVFNWQDWDWRPLARLVGWSSIAAILAHENGVAPLALLGQALTSLILLSVLSFGMLTYLLLLAAMGTLRLAMVFDDAAYALSERIVRPSLGRATFAATFVAAFGAEIGLVIGTGSILRAIHASEWLCVAMSRILR